MKSVTLSGSRKFKKEMRDFAEKLKSLGVTVLAPYHHSGQDEWKDLDPQLQKFVALGLSHDHFYKIAMADVMFVYNPKGYIGNSTTLEIGYAVAMKKPIYALHNDEELCRHVLFREIIDTPEKLVEVLK